MIIKFLLKKHKINVYLSTSSLFIYFIYMVETQHNKEIADTTWEILSWISQEIGILDSKELKMVSDTLLLEMNTKKSEEQNKFKDVTQSQLKEKIKDMVGFKPNPLLINWVKVVINNVPTKDGGLQFNIWSRIFTVTLMVWSIKTISNLTPGTVFLETKLIPDQTFWPDRLAKNILQLVHTPIWPGKKSIDSFHGVTVMEI